MTKKKGENKIGNDRKSRNEESLIFLLNNQQSGAKKCACISLQGLSCTKGISKAKN
jgi:hypothetical protein